MPAVARRRSAWGALWAGAPWDGKAAPPAPAPTPAGFVFSGPPAAAPVPAGGSPGRRRLRQPFGALLAAAPWRGHPDATPAAETVVVPAAAAWRVPTALAP